MPRTTRLAGKRGLFCPCAPDGWLSGGDTVDWVVRKPLGFRWDRARRNIGQAVGAQLHIWCFLAVVAACGLLFGGIVAGQLGDADSSVLNTAVQRLLEAIAQHQLASASDLWWQRLTSDAQLLALIWLLGLSVIGFPFIVAAVFLRSFSVGFAVGFTSVQFGWKGVVVAAVAIFLHQVVSLSALIVAGGIAVRFSAGIVRQQFPPSQLSVRFVRYTGVFALCLCATMAGAAFQAWVAPAVLSGLLAGPAS
ncbi:MAG: stage II sporulation protein M [Alicyclobacillaceae bacterium]|nr:stage II sporulation protein M [Alicyclobacillaceae bacterium]